MMRQSSGNPLLMPVETFLDPSSRTNKLPDTADVWQVLEKFKEGHGAVVLVDASDRPQGVFTPSDMERIRRAFREDPSRSPKAIDLASRPPLSVYSTEPLEYALKRMQDRGVITGIAVVDRETEKYAGYLYKSKIARMLGVLR